MKKKLFWLIVSTVLLTGQGVFAQETNSADQSSQKVDSLLKVVNELSGRVQKTEDDMRNERVWKNRAKYLNIGYITKHSLTNQLVASEEWKSDFGASFAFGKTFYLHKKPLLRMIKFGLDATWTDISYTKYAEPEWLEYAPGGMTGITDDGFGEDEDYTDGLEEDIDMGIHQIDLSMHIGPSITVNPVGHLKVAAYFHYVPTYSVLLIDDSVGHGYASTFAFGASIAFKAISVGIEQRWADKVTYNGFSFDEESVDYEDAEVGDMFVSDKWKMKTKSLRVFLSFRY